MKLAVVVVAFVGVGKFRSGEVCDVCMLLLLLLLCCCRSLSVLRVSLEKIAHRSTAADAVSVAARVVCCGRFD